MKGQSEGAIFRGQQETDHGRRATQHGGGETTALSSALLLKFDLMLGTLTGQTPLQCSGKESLFVWRRVKRGSEGNDEHQVNILTGEASSIGPLHPQIRSAPDTRSIHS